ncbi:MAG: DUF998 domain-containing protein [Candidatus Helarchaeota archaeon]
MTDSNNVSFIDKTYEFIISPKTIIYCGYLLLAFYPGLIIIGVIIANLFGPDIFLITTNYISDLGSINYTPVPILYDLACFFAGILTIPFIYFIEKHIAPIKKSYNDNPPHRWVFRLMGAAYFLNMLGSIFYIGVGIFSEDRDFFGMHTVCSYGAFGGFAIGSIFLGIALIISDQKLLKCPFNYIIGSIGAFLPITVAIFNLIYGGPLLEWLLLFSILIWFIPIISACLTFAKKEISSN